MPNIIMADPKGTPTFQKIKTVTVTTGVNSINIAVPSDVEKKCTNYVIFCDITASTSTKLALYVNSTSNTKKLANTTTNATTFSTTLSAAKILASTNGTISMPNSVIGGISGLSQSGTILESINTISQLIVNAYSGNSIMLTGTVELWGWY